MAEKDVKSSDSANSRTARTVRVFVEFVTIVVGVLVALAVDQWAEEREERALEAAYVSRLTREIAQDTADLTAHLIMLQEKEESLNRLERFLRSSPPHTSDPAEILGEVGTATNFAWNVGPLVRRATYDDLQASGNLGLIEDTDIRFKIVQYYHSSEGRERRIEARRTEFPNLSYRLFPRARGPEKATVGEALELLPDPSLTAADAEQILLLMHQSSLGGDVIAEVNRARFIQSMLSGLHAEATALLDDLTAYAATR